MGYGARLDSLEKRQSVAPGDIPEHMDCSCTDDLCWEYITCAFRHADVNLLKPTGYVMHHQFNIQQLYALPALYLCVLYLSENKQRLVPLTA